MNNTKLRVFAGSGVLVPNYEALDAKPIARRFVGRSFDPSVEPNGGWRPKSEPETLSPSCRAHFDEYVAAIKRGELVPADQATADIAGVIFNPSISNQPKG